MTLMDYSLNDIEKHLLEGSSFAAEYEGFSLSARSVEPGAYVIVGHDQAGEVALTDGAAGVMNLLRLMEQWGGLGAWSAKT